MNDSLLTMIERDVLSWPGANKETGRAGNPGQGGFLVPTATVYRFSRRHIGHNHGTGVADLPFPREIYDELISDGRAKPYAAGFAGDVSYHIREPEDVPRVVELFHINYDRRRAPPSEVEKHDCAYRGDRLAQEDYEDNLKARDWTTFDYEYSWW